ncbi:DUF397 domain-containing protein [Nocardia africana]
MSCTDLPANPWFKSGYSESNSQCVEVTWLADGAVGVRVSKTPAGPALMFAPDEWDAFNASSKAGRFRRS